jgi:hypothetical protein
MKINVHIERLILDEVLIAHREASLVQSAVEAELRLLLSEQGKPANAGGASPRVTAPSIELAREALPVHVGRRIACAIHGSLVKTGGAPR